MQARTSFWVDAASTSANRNLHQEEAPIVQPTIQRVPVCAPR